ncbi:MAG: GTP 3',8-cyclase MoaA [Acidobacteriota bacterium]
MDQLYQIGTTSLNTDPASAGLSAFVRTGGLAPTAAAASAEAPSRLVDSFGRRLTYLRVSVTDRCNLRCVYCLPEDAEFPFGDRDFLSPQEIETLVGTLVHLGIRRVRLTGGEPLVRKDLLEIVARIKALPGVEDLSLSTNGTELERLAPALKAAGLDRVNVSLDTLDPEEFARIARRGQLKQVWRGIEAALEAGLAPVKLNTVLLADGKLEEIERLAELTIDRPLSVRFIEMMPTPANRALVVGHLTCDTVRARLEQRWGPLQEVANDQPRTGPAQAFRFAGAKGEVGFITPLSHTFCADCNRLRLTSRGELRLCLFDEKNHPLRHLLDEPNPEHALEEEILRVLEEKPAEHLLLQGNSGNLASFMSIGG